ncbi:MAG: glucosaminidase domain-containing protein [Treponema sp.]|nr:glucosaminidase domain-containing protein [Treponema sp.]
MKMHFFSIITLFFVLSFTISCVGLRQDVTTDTIPEIPAKIVVEKPELPVYIMSIGKISAEKMANFLLLYNLQINEDYVHRLAEIYIEEAAFEGVNHDIAFTQMCLETGFLRFGGDVKPEQFNFAGLGAIGGGEPGLSFPDPRTGVRAQVQHLKAYGSEAPLNGELVNPRFRFVRRGSSPTIEGLAGTWAADRQYAVKINTMLQRLYDFAF